MNARALADVPVSEIGLGTWQLGGSDYGPLADADGLATLAAAADAGVTFFDTADVYGGGHSEELIGRFLRGRADRDRLVVATKFGRGGVAGHAQPSLDWLRAATEASLRRLGRDALDLTQIHCLPLAFLQRGEVFDWLRALRAEGKIRRFGASVETIEEAKLCLAQDGLASLQIIFSVLRQRPLEELFAAAQDRGVALIVRLPLASGLLAGRYTRATRFHDNDHRTYNRDGRYFNVGETFAGLPFERGVALVDELRALVPPGMPLSQFALRYCLDFDAVTTVIPGAKSPGQAQANVAAAALPPLEPALHQRLRAWYRDRVDAHVRGGY